MSKIVFVGANSDIAKACLKAYVHPQDIILLSRASSQIPPELIQQSVHYDCNPCEADEVNQCFQAITDQHHVSHVVNFCGSVMLKPFSMLTTKDWQQTLAINLNTAFHVAQATVQYVKKNCGLIFFSSAAAHIGLPNHEAIAAAKAGVEGLSKSLAASYAQQNIRTMVISPGLVESKLTQHITKSTQGKQLSLSMHASPRLGQPEDIARFILWLLMPENQWMTGEVFHLDGGLSTTKTFAK